MIVSEKKGVVWLWYLSIKVIFFGEIESEKEENLFVIILCLF